MKYVFTLLKIFLLEPSLEKFLSNRILFLHEIIGSFCLVLSLQGKEKINLNFFNY